MFTNSSFPRRDMRFHPLPQPEYDQPISFANIRDVFSDCADFQNRSVNIGSKNFLHAQVVFIDGIVSGTEISEDVIRPLTDLLRFAPAKTESDCISIITNGGIFSATMQQRTRLDDLISDLTHGCCALLFDQSSVAVTFEVKTSNVRSIGEPTIEKSIKAAKDAFVESLRINTSLIRRRIFSPKLKIYQTTVGRKSRTSVALLYLDGVSDPARIKALKERLDSIDVDGLLTAATLEESLIEHPRSPFPQMLHTERPDKFSSCLLDGHIGLLVEGFPIGFLLPVTFIQFFKVPEDDSQHFLLSSLIELLRYFAVIISLTLPALYVAIAMYHQEMLPLKLLQSIIDSKQSVPFSTPIEIISMLIAFELLQEAGLRLPDPIGQTISIVGALIVGQSAVEAKVISPIAVIVVALAGTCGYTLPSRDLGSVFRLVRLLMVFAAILAGMFGIMVSICLLVWHLCGIDSLGVAYLHPICDKGMGTVMRHLLKLPAKSIKHRDAAFCGRDYRRQK